jgi:hypothetical protein
LADHNAHKLAMCTFCQSRDTCNLHEPEMLGDPNSEVEGNVDASKEGLEEGTLLQAGLLEGDEEITLFRGKRNKSFFV